MARTVNQFLEKLKALEQELIKEGPKIASIIANDATTLAIARLRREGVEGKQYSTDPMLATQNMFNRKDRFKPTEIGTELGRDESGKLVRGGVRNQKGAINRKKAKPKWKWIKFPGAKKAVPVMILEGGYKQLRQLNGLQTAHVDLTFSGRMFQNVKILRPERKQNAFLAVVGATQQEEKNKMAGNRARYGEFLGINEEEKKILSGVPDEYIMNIVKKVLG